MDLLPTDDQLQIIDVAQSLLRDALPVEHARWADGPEHAKDRQVYAQFAQLGWIGLGMPEAQGGVGCNIAEETLLLREAGRFLVPPGLSAAMLCAHTLVGAAEHHIEPLLAGETRAGFAVKRNNGYFLIDGIAADWFLLIDDGRLSVHAAARVRGRLVEPSLDPTISLETTTDLGPAVASDSSAGGFARALVLIAAQLVGASEAVRDMTISHASEREQFGQKIGTFQAVSHPIAEMHLRCEAALCQTKYAAVSVQNGSAGNLAQALAAFLVAQEAALSNARAAVQLHGGIGFAAEYPLHFFLKRAHLFISIGGGRAQHCDALLSQPLA